MRIKFTNWVLVAATLSGSLILSQSVVGQSMEEVEKVKANTSLIWGQGVAGTLKEADDMAIQDLGSQISLNVENQVETTITNEVSGSDVKSSVSTKGNTRTSSRVALSDCRRAYSDEGSFFIVVRYVDRSFLTKMFDTRKTKINDLIRAGENAEAKYKVGDALRYYYWALKLVHSIPEEHRSQLVTSSGALYTSYLPEKIGDVLDSLKVVAEREVKLDSLDINNMVRFTFSYKGHPVNNCEYKYYDSFEWATASVKDGVAVVDLPEDTKNMFVRIEYEYRNLWKSDPMVNTILEQQPAIIPFRQAEKLADMTKTEPEMAPEPVQATKTFTKELAKELTVDSLTECNKKMVAKQADIIAPLIAALETRDYDAVFPLCTANGWKWFEKLVKYGNAQIIERNEIQLSAFANGYLVRGFKARFSFKKNNKSFVEDLVFYIKDGMIEGINFGLEQDALDNINNHSLWDPQSRLVLVNFLENYKTAYALERLDYLDAVFSEDALIIVGNKIPQKRASELKTGNMESYEHNRLTKSQYMKQLERVFAKQEYVNIQFEDASVKKTSHDAETYEILIKQNYYSTTYADQGYLYLLADISNPELPVIHVRVWDEDKNNLMNYGEWNLF